MKNKYLIILLILLAGCATPALSGFSKPTIFFNPLSYLDKFPLGVITQESLISNLGLPDKSYDFDGKTYLSYQLGEGYGLREYVYVISNGVVTDVQYHDQGPSNGSSALKRKKIN